MFNQLITPAPESLDDLTPDRCYARPMSDSIRTLHFPHTGTMDGGAVSPTPLRGSNAIELPVTWET